MSGHCSECGTYHEEDDGRTCSSCDSKSDTVNVVIEGVIPVPKPGEVIVARLDERIPERELKRILEKLRGLFPASAIIVLQGNSEVSLQTAGSPAVACTPQTNSVVDQGTTP